MSCSRLAAVSEARTILSLCLAILLFGCNDRERNVIVDRPPFYHLELPFIESCSDAIVNTVRSFSEEKKMDFLLARETLEPGDYNASANGPSLNVKAIHTAATGRGVDIYAIASSGPTDADRALVEDFVRRLRASCPELR